MRFDGAVSVTATPDADAAQVERDAQRVFDVVRGGGVALIPLDVAYALVSSTPDSVRRIYAAVVAKDSVEALEKLPDQRPDVTITEVEMPRMDGFDLTRNVRADTALKGLPIIMITSRTADKHRQHASELGVDVFLGRPYEEDDLLGHIKTLAARPLPA